MQSLGLLYRAEGSGGGLDWAPFLEQMEESQVSHGPRPWPPPTVDEGMTANGRTQSSNIWLATQVALNGQLITGEGEGKFTSEQASLFQERTWALELVRPWFKSCHLQPLQPWAHGLTSLSLRFLISNMGLIFTSIKKMFVVEHFLYIILF